MFPVFESGERLGLFQSMDYDKSYLMCFPRLGHKKDKASAWLPIFPSLCFSLPLSFHGYSPVEPSFFFKEDETTWRGLYREELRFSANSQHELASHVS